MQGSCCYIVWLLLSELSDFILSCQGRSENNNNDDNVMTYTEGNGTLKNLTADNHACLQSFPCANILLIKSMVHIHTLYKQQEFVLSRCI